MPDLTTSSDVDAFLASSDKAGMRGALTIADNIKIRISTDIGATLDLTTHILGSVGEACTITAFDIVGNASGSTVLDVLKNGSSICSAAKPTLSSASQAVNQTPTGWTTSLAAGDLLSVVVESSTHQSVVLTLRTVKV